ncbi:CD109 antigen [Camelus dromedarius]|uniref:CD109 antigen n=1 Tax=Camelus dromedarius TaxID=9838 RepID=A0A5N4DWZ7_CAMDR|nr:CD109 antigen [Camelus dromedarius]
MSSGYQRELLYQKEDGSFSAFGDGDPSGSTWLSAFVLQCFLEADPYIDIDQNVLHRTYTWLQGPQKSSGEFWEPGRVIHSELQGGNKSPVTLTASTVTSLLGYKKYQPNIDMQESVNFLESEFDRGISDNYTLALVTYALSSVRSPKAKEALNMLTGRAEQEGNAGSLSCTPGHQDTIVALKALSESAALMNTERTNLQGTVMGPSSLSPVKFLIDTQNRFLLQTAELAVVQPMAVNISATGFGFAICQVYVWEASERRCHTYIFTFILLGCEKNIRKTFKVTQEYLATLKNAIEIFLTKQINGSANFSFNEEEMKTVMDFLDEPLEHVYPSPGPVEVLATVTESLTGLQTWKSAGVISQTGISRNASSNVFFKQHDYIIKFFYYATVLKPSLNFTAAVKVTRSDGHQLTPEERSNHVVITATQRIYTEKLYWSRWDRTDQEIGTVQVTNHTVPQNGIFKIEFRILDDCSELQLKVPSVFHHYVTATAAFKLPVFWIVWIVSQFTACLNLLAKHIQLKTRDENIKVGSPFELVVSGNKQLKEVSYMVVSRGQLVAVGKQNSTAFSLTPENSWAPKACIIVYYIEDDGEIINDVLRIPVQLVFKNKIQLFWSKANAEPSEKVSLRISVTQPGSAVGIVAVDKSVNLLNVSNDITMENVAHEFELYNTDYYLGMFMNSFAVFQECSLWILTDANLAKGDIDGVFTPAHLGEIPVTVTAVSPAASDAVTQRLLVKAEGIEKSYSQSILLDLMDSRQQTSLKTLSFSFPPDTVSGSERVQITAIGKNTVYHHHY